MVSKLDRSLTEIGQNLDRSWTEFGPKLFTERCPNRKQKQSHIPCLGLHLWSNFGPSSVHFRTIFGPASVQSGPKLGPTSVRLWPNFGPSSVHRSVRRCGLQKYQKVKENYDIFDFGPKTRSGFGPASVRSGPKLGPSSVRSGPKLGPASVRSGPGLGPASVRILADLGPGSVRALGGCFCVLLFGLGARAGGRVVLEKSGEM
jgi:hypothetical protein